MDRKQGNQGGKEGISKMLTGVSCATEQQVTQFLSESLKQFRLLFRICVGIGDPFISAGLISLNTSWTLSCHSIVTHHASLKYCHLTQSFATNLSMSLLIFPVNTAPIHLQYRSTHFKTDFQSDHPFIQNSSRWSLDQDRHSVFGLISAPACPGLAPALQAPVTLALWFYVGARISSTRGTVHTRLLSKCSIPASEGINTTHPSDHSSNVRDALQESSPTHPHTHAQTQTRLDCSFTGSHNLVHQNTH